MGNNVAIGVIARLTFREAARRWVVWVALALGLLFLAIYAIGFNEIEKDLARQAGSQGRLVAAEIHNFFLMAGLYGVAFLVVFIDAAMFAGWFRSFGAKGRPHA